VVTRYRQLKRRKRKSPGNPRRSIVNIRILALGPAVVTAQYEYSALGEARSSAGGPPKRPDPPGAGIDIWWKKGIDSAPPGEENSACFSHDFERVPRHPLLLKRSKVRTA
jgi:hypothetical protein